MHRRFFGVTMTLAMLASMMLEMPGTKAVAGTVPTGFMEQIVFSGLRQPTNVEFSPDGRIFVAEKSGLIKAFDDFADSEPTIVADLRANVHDMWDRGMLGMALHPQFPEQPWIYVLYAYDAPPGQTAPYWNDGAAEVCEIRRANDGECVVTSRLSRIRIDDGPATEQVLIHDWCQQFPSHSTGDLKFGADGMLYASAGDGASFSNPDYGQFGNPCGDPQDEGGALRSQDVRTSGDPTQLSGTVIRLDPETGLAAAGNANIGSPDLNTRRIVAYGLRNAFRFDIHPVTNEVWLGDVGWRTWEDIERVANPMGAPVNFGWPCYEGAAKMGSYDALDKPLCETLYPTAGPGQTAPHFTYHHTPPIVPGEDCITGGDAIAGMAFYPSTGGSYPDAYDGALFFADNARGCIWAMKPSTPGGLPDPANIEAFVQRAAQPVELELGPGGEIYYVDLGGTVRRIRYFPANQPPVAKISLSAVPGSSLSIRFDGSDSTDDNPGDTLTYQWDFTDDGTWDSTEMVATHTYPAAGTYRVRLRVTDTAGEWSEAVAEVLPENAPPVAVIDTPASGLKWAVGDTVTFNGHGTDEETGQVPASAMRWELRIRHCEVADACHTHVLRHWDAVAGGSFTAPDHEYPSYLELALTVTDPEGQPNTVVRRLDPKTVLLKFESTAPGIKLAAGPQTVATPFTMEVIEGSTLTISAPSPQTIDLRYVFWYWSDLRGQSHTITADSSRTYRANYAKCWGLTRFIKLHQCAEGPNIVRRPTAGTYRESPMVRGRLPVN